MERSAGSLGAIPYVIETPDCSTAGVNPALRIENRPQLDLLEIADGANRLRASQAIDSNRRRRAHPGGRNPVQQLLEGHDVAVAVGPPVDRTHVGEGKSRYIRGKTGG